MTKPSTALKAALALEESVSAPTFIARTRYWLGRMACCNATAAVTVSERLSSSAAPSRAPSCSA